MWGQSVISNCYADGGNITSAEAGRKRASAEEEAAARGRATAFEGISSDPRDPVWADWLRQHGVRR
eukprot:6058469-Prymnesium_polylepis.1